jgi:putative ABC transport system permease protein
VARAHPRVVRVTARRAFSGLIASGDRYVPFIGQGVDAAEDAHFSRHSTLAAGRPLEASRPYGVVAGVGLAEKLEASSGDALRLMAVTPSGALTAVHVSLHGVFQGGLKEYDDWALKVPLPAVQHLLGDDAVDHFVVLLASTTDVAAVRADLERAFRREGLDLELRAWHELALFHNQVVSLFGRELDAIRLIIGTIVILAIANTIGMSILERRIELATLRAIGLRKTVIAALLATETAVTALLGAALGLVLGVGVARVVSAIGIPYPSPPGSTRPFIGGIDVVPEVVAAAFLVSLLATMAAAVLPVWRAVRRPIAATLRQS